MLLQFFFCTAFRRHHTNFDFFCWLLQIDTTFLPLTFRALASVLVRIQRSTPTPSHTTPTRSRRSRASLNWIATHSTFTTTKRKSDFALRSAPRIKSTGDPEQRSLEDGRTED